MACRQSAVPDLYAAVDPRTAIRADHLRLAVAVAVRIEAQEAVLRLKELRHLDGNDLGRFVQIDALETLRKHGDFLGSGPVFEELPTHDIPGRENPDHGSVLDDRQMPDPVRGHDPARLAGGRPGRAGQHVVRHDSGDGDLAPTVGGNSHLPSDILLRDQSDEFSVIVMDDQTADVMGEHFGGGLPDGIVKPDRNDPGSVVGKVRHFRPLVAVISVVLPCRPSVAAQPLSIDEAVTPL